MDFTSSLAAMGSAAGALFRPGTLLYPCMGVGVGVGTVLSVIPVSAG